MKKNLFIFLILCITFYSCKKSKECIAPAPTNQTTKVVWKSYPFINSGAKLILSGASFDKRMFFSGINIFTSIREKNNGTELINFVANHEHLVNSPPIHAENVFALKQNDTILTLNSNSSPYPVSSGTSLWLNVKKLGLNIQKMCLSNHNWGAFTETINDRTIFLVACLLENNQNVVLMLEVENKGRYQPTTLISQKVVALSGTSQYITRIRYLNGYFYLYRDSFAQSVTEFSLRISKDGTEVFNFNNAIPFNSDFVRLGKDTLGRITQNDTFIMSFDKGNTWDNTTYNLPAPALDIMNVKDLRIAYHALYMYNFDMQKKTYKMLDFEGMPTNNINGVHYFRDTVFVSSLGGGLHYKPYKDLVKEIYSK